jgi:hypothetical protein
MGIGILYTNIKKKKMQVFFSYLSRGKIAVILPRLYRDFTVKSRSPRLDLKTR